MYCTFNYKLSEQLFVFTLLFLIKSTTLPFFCSIDRNVNKYKQITLCNKIKVYFNVDLMAYCKVWKLFAMGWVNSNIKARTISNRVVISDRTECRVCRMHEIYIQMLYEI